MPTSNDYKFFTNEEGKSVYSRLATILKNNTEYFDVLVGYFRSSGFYKMYKDLESVNEIRILVGLSVDKATGNIIDQYNNYISSVSFKEGEKIIENNIREEYEETDVAENVNDSVKKFIEWLKSGKLKIRMFTEFPIHAKIYIMRKAEGSENFGNVITGSSNFSENGLEKNFEFNVELKDRPEVEFALEKFEELWKKSQDISQVYIDTIEKDTWVRDDITPYELYLKTIYEYYKDILNSDKEKLELGIPEGYIELQYQIDAVKQARAKLDAYNGVFISDVVGLGKTYICAMLAHTFNENDWKLIICPPVLVDYWNEVIKEFNVTRCDVISLGQLDKICQNQKKLDSYKYIFVDEAHRFRNSKTAGYSDLKSICANKKVILISATPLNNYTSDIENLIYLFQDMYNGNINGIKNLKRFFDELRRRLKPFENGTKEYLNQLSKNAEEIRDKLLREIMIRRTRSEIQKYYGVDLEKQKLTFPEVEKPRKIIYEFDNYTNSAFNQTMGVIKTLTYSRFTSLLYLKDKAEIGSQTAGQQNMGGFMKSILIKRLESSFYAFKNTLNHFVKSYEEFIDMYNKGTVYISKKVNVYDLQDQDDTNKLFSLIERGDVKKYNSSDFSKNLIHDLKNDLAMLQMLKALWSNIDTDPKLDEFKNKLQKDTTLKDNKIIIFSESKDTAEYLCKNLKDIYKTRVVEFSSNKGNSVRTDIEDSFNPKNIEKNNDKYDVLITTDVLAEGINLHRSNVIINYDLPWNPTRIMQRVGRINRVGTKFDKIFVYNFFPTAQSNKQMKLEDRILEKIQAFHETLGDDIKYLSEDENATPKGLFKHLTEKESDDKDYNPELEYLQLIRNIRDNNTDLFEKIKRLPKKAKSSKIAKVKKDSTLTYIQKGSLQAFYISDGNNTYSIPFIKAMEYLESSKTERRQIVGRDYYNQLNNNIKEFNEFMRKDEIASSQTEDISLRGNAKKIYDLLKALLSSNKFTDKEEKDFNILIQQIELGAIPPKTLKDMLDSTARAENEIDAYNKIMRVVPKSLLKIKEKVNEPEEIKARVILSGYLRKGN